jgi:hypothetical protein
MLDIVPTDLREGIAAVGALLTIPTTIAAAALLVRHRRSRRRQIEATG